MSSIRFDDNPHADFAYRVQDEFRVVADRLAEAVEERLRAILAACGVDPDDRSPGWQDRARAALPGLQVDRSSEWTEDNQLTMTAVIRRR